MLQGRGEIIVAAPIGTIWSLISDATRVVFSFFHEPKGLLGSILNILVIRRAQRKNRLAALASLKERGQR
jgi:hypothetical protein